VQAPFDIVDLEPLLPDVLGIFGLLLLQQHGGQQGGQHGGQHGGQQGGKQLY
jgi:hypothetical protein